MAGSGANMDESGFYKNYNPLINYAGFNYSN